MGILDLLGVGLVVFLLLILGVVILCVWVQLRNKKAYYTPTECSICNKPTGVKGSKRFEFIDGFVCENCLKAVNKNPDNIAPLLYRNSNQSVMVIKKALQEIENYNNLSDAEKQVYDMRKQYVQDLENHRVNIDVTTTPKCPRCGSTSISADKKGYGIGKGVVGAAVAGPIGLTLGNAGAKKIRITCLACGYQWIAGKR